MISRFFTGAFLLLSLLPQNALAFIECSVLNYGAVADNSTDLGPALTKAWQECVIPQVTTTVATDVLLYVPAGNYLLASTVTFDDAANWNLHIAGDIFLPFNPDLTGTMITFEVKLCLLLSNGGSQLVDCRTARIFFSTGLAPFSAMATATAPMETRPRLIRFQTCNNCEITEITLFDSPQFHVTIIGNNNVAHDMAIIASHIGETDGFDMSGNNNYVHDVSVENGDECVTVKTPTNPKESPANSLLDAILVHSVLARPELTCSDVTISNSDAGVMIKSYPNCQGIVKNVTFTGFTLDAAAYPICMYVSIVTKPKLNTLISMDSIDISAFWEGGTVDTGTLQISDVTFENFQGSGTPTRPGVLLDCNKATPCESIAFSGISLTNTIADTFTNACGTGLSGLKTC
ncbi:hypothetical protein D9757_009349 [Collybiopsis confluens]|uniref:Glycoside hydrolase family 28 protein n=1 Tax=Collybiopsis confluens TaxID=2823264 RepID=A0A8H5H7C1_9AGAR|nr:hypothetical protein D9757_009349 [Collybiopsis confluens]